MYKITNNLEKEMFYLDTNGKGVYMKPKEVIEKKLPPKDGFGNKLTIEKIEKEEKKLEDKKEIKKTIEKNKEVL